MEPEEQNHRREERIKLPYIIKFRPFRSKSMQNWDAVIPINVSKSGMCFLTMQMFESDQELELLVTNPLLNEQRIYICKVLRCEQSQSRAMFFETIIIIEEMDDEAREAFDKLYQEFLKKSKN